MSQKTQNAVVANAVENATAAVKPNEKGAKVTTREELFAGHASLPRTEQGAIILTDELFRNLAASHTYKYGDRAFKVLEKRSGTERGGKTLYKVRCGADTFTDVSIEELKEELGCEYRREKTSTKTALGKAKFAIDKLAEVIAECNDEEITKAYNQLKGLVSLKRAEEQKRETEEREQRERAERAKRESERADKSADKMSDAALLAELKKRGLI